MAEIARTRHSVREENAYSKQKRLIKTTLFQIAIFGSYLGLVVAGRCRDNRVSVLRDRLCLGCRQIGLLASLLFNFRNLLTLRRWR